MRFAPIQLSDTVWTHRVVLTALSLFFLGTTSLWLLLDRSPPTWDDAWYLTNSLVMFDALADGGVIGYAKRFLTILGFKAPLIAVLPTPIYLIFGRQARAAYAVNLFFMLALFAALYRLGSRYARSQAGLIAVCVAGTMPMLYGLSRWFLVEYTLAALVAVAVWCLAASKILWFGVVCGLGLLLKVTFPIYVAGPFLYWAITTWPRIARGRTWLALAPAALLPLPWYALNYRRTLQTAIEAGVPSAAFYGNPSVVSYFLRLVKDGPSLYYAGLAVVAAAVIAVRRKPLPLRGMVTSAVWLLPLPFFLFGPFKEPRYTAPLLPAFALAMGLLLDSACAALAGWESAALCALLAFPMVAMVQNSFGIFGNWHAGAMHYTQRYDPRPWPHGEILARLRGGKSVLVASDTPHFNADNFALAAAERRLPLEVTTTAYEQDLNAQLGELNSTSFFVYKEGGERGSWFQNTNGPAVIQEVRGGGDFLELPYRPPLPDGGVAHIFRKLTSTSLLRKGASLASPEERMVDCDVAFGDQLQLSGIAVRQNAGALEVKYRWRCLRPPGHQYWCFTHIIDQQNRIVGYLDHEVLDGNPPMTTWREGDVAIERLKFRSTAIRVGKKYHLRLGLFYKPSGERLPVASADLPVTENHTAVCAESR